MLLISDVTCAWCGGSATHLCLDDIPGVPEADVVLRVVESQPILQILLGVLTHLEIKE